MFTGILLGGCGANVTPAAAGGTSDGSGTVGGPSTSGTGPGSSTSDSLSAGVTVGEDSGLVESSSGSTTGAVDVCGGDGVSLHIWLGQLEPPEEDPLVIDALCEVTASEPSADRSSPSVAYTLACDEGEATPTERWVRASSSESFHYPLVVGDTVRFRLEKWFGLDSNGAEYLLVADLDHEVLLGKFARPHAFDSPTESGVWFPLSYTFVDGLCPTDVADEPPEESGFVGAPCAADRTPLGVAIDWDGEQLMMQPSSTVEVDGYSISAHAKRIDYAEPSMGCGSDDEYVDFVIVRRGSAPDGD